MDFTKLWENIQDFAVDGFLRLILAVIVLVIGFKITNKLALQIKKKKLMDKADPGVRSFIGSAVSITLKVVVVLTVATIIGIPMTSLVALLGSAGVAIALALQGGLANVAGGIIILVFKPFCVGDYITVNGVSGTVSGIDVFYTTLVSIDNQKIVVPNGSIANQTITDVNHFNKRRVDLDFTVSYNSDIEKVKKLLSEVISADKKALSDPAPFVRLTSHGDSALVFTVRAWCETNNYWDLRFDLLENVKNKFDENGIEIPYPQMDVHVDNK